MDWLQITIECTAAHGEHAGDLLTAAGADAVTLRAADAPALYEPGPGEVPLWDRVAVTGLFAGDRDAAALMERLRSAAAPGVILGMAAETLADRQWERTCLEDFHPVQFGRRTWVCPSWCEPPQAPDAVVVRLDPGLAFGTGGHATTALCLEWIDGHPCRGRLVIDYGCGSGLLGIAAALHGAAPVWCVDHDPQALLATAENARHNGVSDRIKACPPEGLPPLQADILIANILAAPLLELAPRFAALVRPGGAIVLSGLLASQAAALRAAYRPWFDIDGQAQRDEWLRLSGVRTAP